ncbi:TM2 domain-containing protein [Mycoplasma iguanae]|uniref:TM2 domain-containing protein n=1 Tax=Mycoplasma iguanae TaxID=292461 RepID=A0ABY5RAC5_9MOLU|nr:TM2 domain-containing protein [Mycoplasma iguanae]UVD81935.1 TM2 domain-containing protein [Mycoplasma iguanae]
MNIKIKSKSSKIVLIILSFFSGFIGIDDFYLKKYITGILKLLFFGAFVALALFFIFYYLPQMQNTYKTLLDEIKDKFEKDYGNPNESTSFSQIWSDIQNYFMSGWNTFREKNELALYVGGAAILFAITIVFYWIFAVISSIFGRRDRYGHLVSFKGATLEEILEKRDKKIAQAVIKKIKEQRRDLNINNL